jgi:hypothetical protein
MKSLQEIWKYNFEIFFVLCIFFILILFLYHKITGKKGTWSKSYYYQGKMKQVLPSSKKLKKESSGEQECRRVLQNLFKKPFTNERPNFLRNPVTGGNYNLEIDCFNNELKLGIEYNGAQHYKYIPFFHKNKEAFLNQKYRDELKKRICVENGVTLIEVPNTVKVEDIERYLERKLRSSGYI